MEITDITTLISQMGFPIAIAWYLFKIYLPAQEARQDALLDKFMTFSRECSDNVKAVVTDNNTALTDLRESIDDLRQEINRQEPNRNNKP